MKLIINTPVPGSSEFVPKEIVVGCGVKIILEGSRFTTEATVEEIVQEDPMALRVKGHGFEAVIGAPAIRDVFPPAVHEYQKLHDKTFKETDHRTPEADKDWPDIPAATTE